MADPWLAPVGWLGNPLALLGEPAMDFNLNVAASPTWGTRIKDKVVQGGGYLGVGFSLGLSLPFPVTIPFVGHGSIGVAWDPVVPVAMVFDSHEVENRGYMNFALTWTMKWNTETKTLPWKN